MLVQRGLDRHASGASHPGCGSQHPRRFACVLLAAAPTTTPCFRHWRRSSLLPLVGEPLAKRLSFAKCQGLSLWESWREAPERARLLQVKHRHSDSIALTKSLPIAAQRLFRSGLALSVTFGATARVAAPSVCFAVACILLAAAPTAPPCFRRWRRSSPLLPEGEAFEQR